ncbi:Phosphoribosylanthranilate isomerase [Pseudovibrio sp. FO-BEG1]|uniref:phosphoribosylanthranilate isomerase n=1 Tax=Pseudovibrio TaxID=258255 RepID=UPI000186C6D3|nr:MULTISPECIES: phosphoribosylanthranilate isomerase [unclassified Pseudovibrio]AEV35561.1 Phosphoribosylanthranilate isomerase [Pseudovibrio sp. FO-BEG1]EEA92402.1 N-(5'phosphoribosyl)anthranilate isomerase [Pseudovibrio sp. JE062]
MPNNARTRLKVCCISTSGEAATAVACGADAVGLVAHMPSGPGVIEDDLILNIARQIPPAVATWLLTSRTTAREIVEHVLTCGTNTVQIVSPIDPGEYQELRLDLPASTRIVQVVHVEDEYSFEIAQEYGRVADAVLLDSGRPSENELGGTGRTHNWDLSRHIVEKLDVPVFLAGGLTPQNIIEAIETVKPYGVDVCSGVRVNGRLNRTRLTEFAAAIACT